MRRRILIGLSLLLAVCLLGDVTAILCLGRSIRQLSALAESHRIQSMRAILASSGVRVQLDVLSHVIGHEHAADRRAEHAAQFTESLRRCGGCHHPPHLQAELDGIREAFTTFQDSAERFFASSDAEQTHGLEQQVLTLADRFVEQTAEMADKAGRHLAVSSATVAGSIHDAWVVLSATFLILLAGGGIVAFHLKGRLTKPVEALLEGVARVRMGDLDYRFPVDTDEEFRVLGEAFNQTYEDLTKARESMLQAEKLAATGKLAAGVAHEVLNPLASISSVAQFMRRRCESEEQGKQIDLIMTEIARISRILRELLTFSRPSAAETHRRVEIGPLLEHVATLIGYDRRAQKVQIVKRIDTGPYAVVGDPERLRLVFTNIMLNALDAMSGRDGGSGALTMSSRDTGDRVEIVFTDDGPGMEEEHLEHAFDPFFTTKELGAGTGLGLWICYQVIQEHKGHIRLDSQLGKGTTVTIHLPRDDGRCATPTTHS